MTSVSLPNVCTILNVKTVFSIRDGPTFACEIIDLNAVVFWLLLIIPLIGSINFVRIRFSFSDSKDQVLLSTFPLGYPTVALWIWPISFAWSFLRTFWSKSGSTSTQPWFGLLLFPSLTLFVKIPKLVIGSRSSFWLREIVCVCATTSMWCHNSLFVPTCRPRSVAFSTFLHLLFHLPPPSCRHCCCIRHQPLQAQQPPVRKDYQTVILLAIRQRSRSHSKRIIITTNTTDTAKLFFFITGNIGCCFHFLHVLVFLPPGSGWEENAAAWC